ncbi:MAG: hypothetical protein V4496_06785 [Pseudomonadota bacterium]
MYKWLSNNTTWLSNNTTWLSNSIAGFFYDEETAIQSQQLTTTYTQLPIREEFVFLEEQKQGLSIDLIKQISPYIGMIDNGFHSGMGCLLNDGTLLTALHIIYDLEKGEYRPLELITISFLKENKLYYYKVDDIIHDGTSALRAALPDTPSTYDYARLRLTGNPINDLGEGLLVDTKNYFGLTVSNPKPSMLLSVSAPKLERTPSGELVAKRYVSMSKNKSLATGFYTFPVIGKYFRNQGFSGQAIFPFGDARFSRNTLYAVHEGYDKGEAIGFECSEYDSQVRSSSRAPFGPGVKPYIPFDFIPEVLTKENINDIEIFLTLLRNCANTRSSIDPSAIPALLLIDSKCDTHQPQHMKKGIKRQGKTIICPHIAETADHQVMIALINTIDLLSRHYYRKSRDVMAKQFSEKTKTNIPDKTEVHARHDFYKKLIAAINIIVDLECCISDRDTRTNNEATAFYIDGFASSKFHIVPVDSRNPGLKTTHSYSVKADDIIKNAKLNLGIIDSIAPSSTSRRIR